MKHYSLTITVDEDQLLQNYLEAHAIKPDECPDTESMILSELGWLNQSGISASGDLIDCDRTIEIVE